jgi:serine protein kinase
MMGISPRYIISRLSSPLVREGCTCINPLDTLRALKDGFEQHTGIAKDEREAYINLIYEAGKEHDELAKTEIQRAFIYSYEETARTVFKYYLENVEAQAEGGRPDHRGGGRTGREADAVDRGADRDYRECQEGVPGGDHDPDLFLGPEGFTSVSEDSAGLAPQGTEVKFDYTSHDRLREAIEKKLFADLKNVVKITTSTRTPDPEQQKRMNDVVENLVEDHGYCEHCANELIQYVGTLLSR